MLASSTNLLLWPLIALHRNRKLFPRPVPPQNLVRGAGSTISTCRLISDLLTRWVALLISGAQSIFVIGFGAGLGRTIMNSSAGALCVMVGYAPPNATDL